ncbi:MAG TPA: hypothetical protein VJ487_10645 [Alphaproteobacteria bacterium]|nr:hypothetical protein [Alphaproteobacteria bacterium]
MENREGRRRLCIMLCVTSGLLCFAAMVAVLVVYGTPYRAMWWIVMAIILLAAFFAPLVFVRPVEWVIRGYLGGEGRK